ncbi:amidohydrolase family protein [Phenylobacterium sp. LjRoot219]|uniref:amidohydrolase family protein n=1 Tax=Phenylobacterium sp. LjRoot219 TaxID=3342283 RepID=UPI003ECFA5CD
MDIVDAQLHLGRGKIEATLEAMDALGVRSVLIDEFWGEFGGGHPTHIQPGYRLANGAWRAASPTAEEASLRYPDRFSYLVRIDPRDPELESVMRTVASSPNARAFRLQPVWTLDEVEAFANGAYEPLLELAQDLGLPVCVFIPGYVELLRPYVRKFARQTFIIDHCGMGFPNIPPGRPAPEAQRALEVGYFAEVLKLADFPNVALKWSHAQDGFGVKTYPYEGLRPLLRQAIAAFGPQRLMWASDNTVIPGHSWSEMLFALRDDPELAAEEKAWILGASARQLLNWPAEPVTPAP